MRTGNVKNGGNKYYGTPRVGNLYRRDFRVARFVRLFLGDGDGIYISQSHKDQEHGGRGQRKGEACAEPRGKV